MSARWRASHGRLPTLAVALIVASVLCLLLLRATLHSRRDLPPNGYVGSAACAKCHAEVYNAYQSHPMSRSMSRVPGESTIETYDSEVFLSPGGLCVYGVHKEDEIVTHHELMLDRDNEVIYDQAVPIHYAVGSGVRGRSYLTDRGGIMFMSPISWYSAAEKWDLSPGFFPDDPQRFDRRATDQCLACHAGRVGVQPGSPDRYQRPPFPELAIGCENCHGPGKEHVQTLRAGSICNPADLDPLRRESICNQCHLHGSARIPRYGRTAFDFRPGSPLGEVITVLVAGSGISEQGTTKSVTHVQQMRESACFRKSSGGFGCISCHDPHSAPAPELKVAFYGNRCMHCHADLACALPLDERLRMQADNSCIACHMAPLTAHDIAHAVQTDHRVLRSSRNAPDTVNQMRSSALLTFFDGADQYLERWETDRALGLVRLMKYESDRQPAHLNEAEKLLRPILKIAPDDLVVLEALGSIAWEQERFDQARQYFETALLHQPRREASLLKLVKVCYRTGDFQAGLQYIEKLLAINPWNHEVYAWQADMRKAMGRLPEAIEAAEKGLQLNPRMTSLRTWLAASYQEAGRQEESGTQHSILRRMNH